MTDKERLDAILAIVIKYLPPDGISMREAMNEIVYLVDPPSELKEIQQ